MILDGHTHLFSQFGFLRGMDAGEFVDKLKSQRVDGAVVMTLEGFTKDDSRLYNDQLHAATERYPEYLCAFGTVHPRDGSGAISEMQRCVKELGMKGFKFHPWLQAFCASGREMFPIVQEAVALDVPLLFHDGTPPYCTSLQIAYLARCFPEATIILGHSGLRDYWREALYAAMEYENIILQFCGTPDIAMREMIEQVGPERCIFGSDFPFPGDSCIELAVSQIKNLDVSDAAKDAILGENLKRILNL